MESKICGWCKLEKPLSEFAIRKKNGKERPRLECMECQRVSGRKRYKERCEIIKERNRLYYEKHRDRIGEYKRSWDFKNDPIRKKKRKKRYQIKKEEIKAKRKEYYYLNKDKCVAQVSEYARNNRDKINARLRSRHTVLIKTDPSYQLIKRLRGRINAAVKNRAIKAAGTRKLVGCTIPELIAHLESKFQEGMSWGNYSFRGWHIDHIIPCAAFDLTNPEEQKKCFHYTNLQPLWWLDNIKKGAKIIEPKKEEA